MALGRARIIDLKMHTKALKCIALGVQSSYDHACLSDCSKTRHKINIELH